MADHPASVPAARATFLKDTDMVIGVVGGGKAKAYWLPMVIWLHRIRDDVGGAPVLVTWCSMCNSGLVFRPVMDGTELTFSVPGLRGGNLVLQDDQTGSRWQQGTGQAFAGPMKGRRLPLVPFLIVSWKEWRTRNPESLAMVPDPKDQTHYEAMDHRIAEPVWEMQPAPLALRQDSRLPPHTMVLGVEHNGSSTAYPIDTIKDEGLINDRVGSFPILIVYTASGDSVTAFARLQGGRTLEFKQAGNRLTDKETGSTWNRDGECVGGSLKGKMLESVILEPAYWFAWAEFYPQTVVYSPYEK